MTINESKLLVEKKVEDFSKNEKQYLSKTFQETEARTRFIDPFFQALGWDFDQTNMSKQFWDVHREYSQKDNSNTKKPDYAFNINGKLKFFVEAKAPWVPLTDKAPVFQAKRYAYSTNGKAPVVIITDFQEFRVFNAIERPVYDNPLQGLIKEFDLTYNVYINKWDLIYGNFSKEAVMSGSIDKLLGKVTKETKTLDKEFLSDLINFREILAKNIAIRNKELDVDTINECVQRILDRLIFIRNLEDREIENENLLLDIINEQGVAIPCYQKLIPVFSKLNDDYNGLLFKPDISDKVIVDDDVIKKLIKNLYPPYSPFQFDIIEPEILGRIYEKFLGSKIRLTDSHQAKVEEKPEVRHAGGVFYTPQFIVEYIVENTVGEMIKSPRSPLLKGERYGLTPEDIEKIKILDPACGSGSFLLGAFDYLIKYHERFYSTVKTQSLASQRKYKEDFFVTPDREIRLTIKKKSEILKNNIFGVDIDREATEVAIMSLYLKLLDQGFDKGQGFLFLKGHILPDMTGNIKCGNSLIESDFYTNETRGCNPLFPDIDEMRKVNVFDWEAEGTYDKKNNTWIGRGFPEIMKSGGFDCVIGNPPYVRIQILNEYSSDHVNYYNKKYSNVISDNYDIYVLFIYKGFNLLKNDGLLGYILPHKFFQAQMGEKIRKIIYENKSLNKIIDFTTNQIFENVTTYTCLFFLSKNMNETFVYKRFSLNDEFNKLNNIEYQKFNIDILNIEMWNFSNNSIQKILDKIKKQEYKFTDITHKIFKGSSTGNDNIYLLEFIESKGNNNIYYSKELKQNIELEKNLLYPFLYGEDIRRYEKYKTNIFLLFPYEKNNDNVFKLINFEKIKNDYPLTYNYLKLNKNKLSERKIPISNEDFYKYSAARSLNEYCQTKIMIPDMLVKIRVGYDDKGIFFHGPAIHSIVFNDKVKKQNDYFYYAILNSKLFWFFISNTSTALRGNAYRLTPEFLNPFCFPKIDLYDKSIKHFHDFLVSLATQMLETQKQFHDAKTDNDKKLFKQKIDMIDKQIDEMVYKLYGLTDDEIKIIEGNNKIG